MPRIFNQYVSPQTFSLLAADVVVMSASFLIGIRLRYLGDAESWSYYSEMPDFAYRIAVAIGVFIFCGYYNGLYSPRLFRGLSDQFFKLLQTLGFACFILAMLYFVAPVLRVGRGAFAAGLAAVLIGVFLFRAASDLWWRSVVQPETVAIVGDGDLAAETAHEIAYRRDLRMHIAGFIALRPLDVAVAAGQVEEARVLGSADHVEEIVKTHRIQRLIVADDRGQGLVPFKHLLKVRTRGTAVEDAHAVMTSLTGRIPLNAVESSWFLFSAGFRRSRYQSAFKRLVDLVLSSIGLVCSLPIMALTAAAVKLDSRGPALFRQRRLGLNGQTFELMKFRTMREDAEADGVARWAEENDPRLTRIGGFLRKYRFDELPQFINVIRGQMSFVGPRPERPEFVERLRKTIPYYDERLTMRPGITGWAQVCYPYGATEEDALRKLEYDLFYLKNVSILFDIAIVFQTIKIILTGRGR
ncbi:MAG: sugar transferase [Bryobacterales bacterium]